MNNAIFALNLTPQFGHIRFKRLQSEGIDPSALIRDPDAFRQALVLRAESIDYLKQKNYQSALEAALKWSNQSDNHHLISIDEKAYPQALKMIAEPPLILYVRGRLTLLDSPQIGVVGTRHYSQYGRQCTEYLTTELVKNGLTITSGLATGIDTFAHLSALNHHGNTIAVIGTGIDLTYPSANRQLAERIAKEGAIISEFQLQTEPSRFNFPVRNRIISGLSKGIIVIESAAKSGSLITAFHALEQNREVFAVPGNIFHTTSAGCHKLIQLGAVLVTKADDILTELDYNPVHQFTDQDLSVKKPALDQLQQTVFNAIDSQITSIDEIIHQGCLIKI
ncbi:MAG: DNA-processing protein DprA [Francisellaceae bacterium]